MQQQGQQYAPNAQPAVAGAAPDEHAPRRRDSTRVRVASSNL
jgi:hypothetical protein